MRATNIKTTGAGGLFNGLTRQYQATRRATYDEIIVVTYWREQDGKDHYRHMCWHKREGIQQGHGANWSRAKQPHRAAQAFADGDRMDHIQRRLFNQ